MLTLCATIPVILNDAARGLAQQMVFWGRDVRHFNGNALVRFGLERAPSSGLTGTSCYSMAWRNGLIELHGAVATYVTADEMPGCTFSRATGRIDLWHANRPPIPGRESGVPGAAVERWQAAHPLIEWLVVYEKWIVSELGAAWRTDCWRTLKKLPKGKPWLPPELALKWWELAAAGEPPRPKDLLKS